MTVNALDDDDMIAHLCPADGSMHENSSECVCGPTKTVDPDDSRASIWEHHSYVEPPRPTP
jgi:hypothetical protein